MLEKLLRHFKPKEKENSFLFASSHIQGRERSGNKHFIEFSSRFFFYLPECKVTEDKEETEKRLINYNKTAKRIQIPHCLLSPSNTNLNHHVLQFPYLEVWRGFPGGSVVKNPPATTGDMGSIPGLGRSPGAGNATYPSIPAWESHGQRNLEG